MAESDRRRHGGRRHVGRLLGLALCLPAMLAVLCGCRTSAGADPAACVRFRNTGPAARPPAEITIISIEACLPGEPGYVRLDADPSTEAVLHFAVANRLGFPVLLYTGDDFRGITSVVSDETSYWGKGDEEGLLVTLTSSPLHLHGPMSRPRYQRLAPGLTTSFEVRWKFPDALAAEKLLRTELTVEFQVEYYPLHPLRPLREQKARAVARLTYPEGRDWDGSEIPPKAAQGPSPAGMAPAVQGSEDVKPPAK